jgi:hypothetical protein
MSSVPVYPSSRRWDRNLHNCEPSQFLKKRDCRMSIPASINHCRLCVKNHLTVVRPCRQTPHVRSCRSITQPERRATISVLFLHFLIPLAQNGYLFRGQETLSFPDPKAGSTVLRLRRPRLFGPRFRLSTAIDDTSLDYQAGDQRE